MSELPCNENLLSKRVADLESDIQRHETMLKAAVNAVEGLMEHLILMQKNREKS